MLTIKNSVTLSDIETSITKIISNPGLPIKLPTKFLSKRMGALHDVARLQMMVTWARHANDQYIYFDQQSSVQDLLENLCTSAAGIASLRLAKGIKCGGQTIERRDALIPAAKRMELADREEYSEIIKGRALDLISVSGAQVQYLRPLFYERSKASVKPDIEMSKTFAKLIAEINKTNDKVPYELIKALGVFTHELFQNTQEHATTDYLNAPLSSGHLEGVAISWNQLLEHQTAKDFMGHERLRDFWNREVRITGNDQRKVSVRCLQISFFDTGPGLVSRATGKLVTDLTQDSEFNELVRCLQKNVTTKGEPGAGQGLPNVLAVLQKIGGVIRIRSGRKAIFNAFSADDEIVDLYDFQNWSESELSPVEGAVITIIIPLRKQA